MTLLAQCLHPGCKNLVRKAGPQKCIGHRKRKINYAKERKYDRERAGSRDRRFYKTKVWQVARTAALALEPICLDCRMKVATEVDHVDNDRNNLKTENLRPLCKSCHSRKTVKYDGGLGK